MFKKENRHFVIVVGGNSDHKTDFNYYDPNKSLFKIETSVEILNIEDGHPWVAGNSKFSTYNAAIYQYF